MRWLTCAKAVHQSALNALRPEGSTTPRYLAMVLHLYAKKHTNIHYHQYNVIPAKTRGDLCLFAAKLAANREQDASCFRRSKKKLPNKHVLVYAAAALWSCRFPFSPTFAPSPLRDRRSASFSSCSHESNATDVAQRNQSEPTAAVASPNTSDATSRTPHSCVAVSWFRNARTAS